MARAIRLIVWLWVCASLALLSGEWFARTRFQHVSRRNPSSLVDRIEIGAHLLLDRERGLRYRPNADVVIHNVALGGKDVRMQINSIGFRDREVAAVKRHGELRVLVLGDSVTSSDFLPLEELYVERIERDLQASWRHGPVEVINSALGNIGIREEIKILEDSGLALKPDIVLLAFYLNDATPPWEFSASLSRRNWLLTHSVLAARIYVSWQLWHFERAQPKATFSWLRAQHESDWKRDRNVMMQMVRRAKRDWGATWQPHSRGIVASEFAKLRDHADEAGFEVVVAVFPVRFQVEADYLERAPQQMVEAEARAHGFHFVDLLPLLREHRGEKLFYDHCHLVSSANAIVGESLARFLTAKVLPGLEPRS